MRQSATLIVLDNFEQLVEGSAVLTDLLTRSPETRALVTSQLPLRLAGERVFRLEPLEQEAAIALFAERARTAQPEFDLDAEREAVEAICARADHVPLTLELAAARIAVIPPRELVARLDRSLEVLGRGPRDVPERHRSVRSTLDGCTRCSSPARGRCSRASASSPGRCRSTPSRPSRRPPAASTR